jgi:RHS repeat-associated protein
MKRIVLVSLFAVLSATAAFAQQPFEQYGYKVKVATLSRGKYLEFFDQDSLVQIGSVMLNQYTGKIVSFVQVDTVYSEATLEPELVSRWLSPDPLSEKYSSLSPYNFVANNPVLLVDPDGREIWISYGDNQRVKYDNGKLYNEDGSKYKGKDAFVSTTMKTLSAMGSTKNGKTVLGELSKSENSFNFTNTYMKDSKGNDVKGTLALSENKNGGGEIHAAGLMEDTNFAEKIENTAHELYHGYQHEIGQGGVSINNEVEANLFGRSVALAAGVAYDYGFGNQSRVGDIYNSSMLNMLTSPVFNQKDFQMSVMTFKVGSRKNERSNGIYNNFPYKSMNKSTIARFYPLLDQ